MRRIKNLIVFESPVMEINKIILDETVYQNETPHTSFIILKHILINNLVQ